MFETATRHGDQWLVQNAMGHRLCLPCKPSYMTMEIATLGTRRRVSVKTKVPMTGLMAEMLDSLQRPLYVLDVRRDGTGAQSSWSPREFASVIPGMLAGGRKYAYVHLPCLAPSVALLAEKSLTRQQFRDRYLAELSDDDLSVGEAFAESASAQDGMAVLMCAEPDQPDYDNLPEAEKEACYCHRFPLIQQIAGRLKARHPGLTVRQVRLDLVDFHQARQAGNAYYPRASTL